MLDASLDAVRRHRRTDPKTSMDAAHRAAPLAHSHSELILRFLVLGARPMGATELSSVSGLSQAQICRRLPELLRDGWIRVAEGRGRTVSGREERLWVPLF